MEPVGKAAPDAFEESDSGWLELALGPCWFGLVRITGLELGIELDFDEFFAGLFDAFPPLWSLGCRISLSFSSSSLHSSTAAAALFRLIIGLVHVRPKNNGRPLEYRLNFLIFCSLLKSI